MSDDFNCNIKEMRSLRYGCGLRLYLVEFIFSLLSSLLSCNQFIFSLLSSLLSCNLLRLPSGYNAEKLPLGKLSKSTILKVHAPVSHMHISQHQGAIPVILLACMISSVSLFCL
jgi:hypothetical protein